MIVERTKREVVVRIPNNALSIDDLQAILDWITFKAIAKKSKATQKEVNNLVKQIKKGRWNRAKARLGL